VLLLREMGERQNRRIAMNRKQLMILGAAGALLFSAGAWAEPQMTTDMAHDVNFANYHTFSWASAHPQGGMNPVQYQEIMNSITTYLSGKGYRRQPPGDLTMALTLGKRQKVDIDTWNHYGYHDAYVYNEGQISLDAFDTKTKRAVWHGQITDTIDPQHPDVNKLHAALNQLVKEFPGH
jgi:hypothetical protein